MMQEQQIRVGALCIAGDKVLLHRMAGESWWAVPGGRIEVGELATEALAREMHEEVGLGLQLGSLRAVIETKFRHRDTEFHEVCLYFLASVEGLPSDAFTRSDGDLQLEFAWFSIAGLEDVDVRPRALIEALTADPRSDVQHLVQLD